MLTMPQIRLEIGGFIRQVKYYVLLHGEPFFCLSSSVLGSRFASTSSVRVCLINDGSIHLFQRMWLKLDISYQE